MNRIHPIRTFASAAAVTLGGMAVTAGIAEAVVVDTDPVKVNSQLVDFGKLARLFGAPVAGGDVAFDVTNGVVTASVTGRTHVTNLAGSCGQVRIEFLDADGIELEGLERIGETLCPTNNNTFVSALWTRSASHPEIAGVRVITELEDNGEDFVETASRSTLLGPD